MAQTIDLKTTTLVIQPSKNVKFAQVMGGGGSAGKNVSFANKEYANVAKTVVLVGQSLKKLNVNVRDIKKLLAEDKKLQVERSKQEKLREQRRVRERRERSFESRNNNLKKGTDAAAGAINKVAGGAKGLLGMLMNSPIGGLFTIGAGIVGAAAIRKLLDSNFVAKTINAFVGAVSSIVQAIGQIPTSTLDKIGTNVGKVITFLGNFFSGAITNAFKIIEEIPQSTFDKVGKAIGKFVNFVVGFTTDRFKDIFKGLDKIIDDDGNLKFDFDGIVQLLTGVGGLALTYRYLKNPGKVVSDVGSILGFFGKMVGAIPGGGAIQKMLGMTPGGRMGQDLGTRRNPMHVYVVNQGGGGGGPLDDFPSRRGPGLRPQNRFTAPRGGGLNRGGNFLSRLMRGGKNQVLARPGSIINESTGMATRMLGGNKASAVSSAMRSAGVSNANRARVLSGMLDQGVATKIAQSGGPKWLQNLKGLGSMGKNLLRGSWDALGAGVNQLKALGGLAWNGMKDAGGKAVSGLSGTWKKMGDGLKGLNPLQMLENIKNGVGNKVGDMMDTSPLIKNLKNLKDPKKIKALLTGLGGKVKPVIGTLKEARKAFRIPGVDVLIGALTAVTEIGMGYPAGNAMLGALGGILGSSAGLAVGTPFGPPGMAVGAIGGGIAGELVGRALARGFAKFLPAEIAGYSGINGAPLFSNGEFDPSTIKEKKARGGKIFGGKPTGDSVPALLERGEYVMNRKAVAAIGPGNLDRMNFGMFPRYQSGGMIVTSGMGLRNLALSPGMHMGVDIAHPDGTAGHPLQAFTDGVVEATSPPSPSAGYGNWINWIDKDGVGHLYAHMQNAPTVRAGTRVRKGTILGHLGSTGRSEGPHLHWETATNPRDTGMPKSSVLTRFNPLSKYGKDAPFGGDITPDPSLRPRGPFVQDNNMMAGAESAPSSGIFAGISLAPTANGNAAGGVIQAAQIKALTDAIFNNVVTPLRNDPVLGQPTQIPAVAQQTSGGSSEPLVSASDSAGSIQNNLYELVSFGGNG